MRYQTENYLLAIGLVLIVLFADSLSVLITDIILGLLEFKWRY